eukprot:TRINITY_DN23323_c0_g1_i2.p1 TRINITY_DN23323_c0_g1~~TRINITY_DN23323_c0_g1_i2.p1  ORF type:complete len:226 (-),score=44.20 TRINITY_DN23323_c0_g1_i2:10-687(-)
MISISCNVDVFFNETATTEIYTRSIVGSVRCVQETGINAEYMGAEKDSNRKYFEDYLKRDIPLEKLIAASKKQSQMRYWQKARDLEQRVRSINDGLNADEPTDIVPKIHQEEVKLTLESLKSRIPELPLLNKRRIDVSSVFGDGQLVEESRLATERKLASRPENTSSRIFPYKQSLDTLSRERLQEKMGRLSSMLEQRESGYRRSASVLPQKPVKMQKKIIYIYS